MAGQNPLQNTLPGLDDVKNIIAVSSCKGGVGKSTTAVNFACALAARGLQVGLFDADVYGPSLPTMIRPEKTELYQEQGLIVPLEYKGLKLMSFGYVSQESGGGKAAIMRGPMVSQVINQLLTGTQWGTLDVLVLDLPPGTGDIQLTLSQLVSISAAVMVTTPQQLSFVDVVKGIQMFDKLKIPTVAVVENMSYYECPGCGDKARLFGEGARERLTREFGFQHTFEIPLVPALSTSSDGGRPYFFDHPAAPAQLQYQKLAETVCDEIKKLSVGSPELIYNVGQEMILSLPDGGELSFAPAELRRACRCAHCVQEMTGEQILKPEDIADDVYPEEITPMGNYAAAVNWSDGHNSSIYAYEYMQERFGK